MELLVQHYMNHYRFDHKKMVFHREFLLKNVNDVENNPMKLHLYDLYELKQRFQENFSFNRHDIPRFDA